MLEESNPYCNGWGCVSNSSWYGMVSLNGHAMDHWTIGISVTLLRFGHWLRFFDRGEAWVESNPCCNGELDMFCLCCAELMFSSLLTGWRRGGLESHRKVECLNRRLAWWHMQWRKFIFVLLGLRILLKHILQHTCISI